MMNQSRIGTIFGQLGQNSPPSPDNWINISTKRPTSFDVFTHTPTILQRELLLELITFQAGILDVAVFIANGVFVANMIGNVVLLGIAIAHLYRSDVSRNIVALITFFISGFLTGVSERPIINRKQARENISS